MEALGQLTGGIIRATFDVSTVMVSLELVRASASADHRLLRNRGVQDNRNGAELVQRMYVFAQATAAALASNGHQSRSFGQRSMFHQDPIANINIMTKFTPEHYHRQGRSRGRLGAGDPERAGERTDAMPSGVRFSPLPRQTFTGQRARPPIFLPGLCLRHRVRYGRQHGAGGAVTGLRTVSHDQGDRQGDGTSAQHGLQRHAARWAAP